MSMTRRFSFRRAAQSLTAAVCTILVACSGGRDSTGPDLPDDEPGPGPVVPGPGPVDPGPGPADPGPGPGPVDPGPGQPGEWQAAGIYTLTMINQSTPGQLVTLANPDGSVVGLLRFSAGTTLVIDPVGGWSLSFEYTDDKTDFQMGDKGEYKWHGVEGGIWLDFTSELYGDEFDGAAAPDGSAAINYDFDGDGTAETRFVFQQVTGG
jgi:hypothetical protein